MNKRQIKKRVKRAKINKESGKGEPRGYCRALKDIETMVRDMKQEGVTE